MYSLRRVSGFDRGFAMIKQLFTHAVVASLVCGLGACTTLRVTSDVNQPLAANVKCHSFAWAGSFQGSSDTLRSTVANPVNESRLRAAIQSNLGTVGVPLAGGDADCLVGYGIGQRNVVDGYPYGGYGWGGGFGWRGGWGGWGGYYGGWGYPYVYTEGIIGVDIYDAKSKQALWHASVDQSLKGATGDKADQKIKAAVAAIFTKYPHI
jgi:hypothetical protein